MTHTLLIAVTHAGQREYLARELDADGYTVHETDNVTGAMAKLTTHPIDVLLLGALERRADSPTLLRTIRSGHLRGIHPDQPVITLGADDEISVLRAYEAGSDHHLPDATSYLLLRAVLQSVARRVLGETDARHLRIGALHIDTAAQTAAVNGHTITDLTRTEWALLVKFASDPTKVHSKDALARAMWGSDGAQGRSTRSIDSHVCRLRNRLRGAGAEDLLQNRWGQGYVLTPPNPTDA